MESGNMLWNKLLTPMFYCLNVKNEKCHELKEKTFPFVRRLHIPLFNSFIFLSRLVRNSEHRTYILNTYSSILIIFLPYHTHTRGSIEIFDKAFQIDSNSTQNQFDLISSRCFFIVVWNWTESILALLTRLHQIIFLSETIWLQPSWENTVVHS